MDYILSNNESKKRYEIVINDAIAFVEYILTNDNTIYLTHTEVPKELEGKGIGSALVNLVLEEVEHNKWGLMPLCPFVAAFIKRHPEWMKLVKNGIKIS